MKRAIFSLIVAPVMLLAGCALEPQTLDKVLGGESEIVTMDLAQAYPSAKSLFIVCTSDDAALADVFGKDVLDDPADDENWMVQQRFDSVLIAEPYKRDRVDLCGGNREEIREVTNEKLDFEQRDGTWTLVGERGVDVEDLPSAPVD